MSDRLDDAAEARIREACPAQFHDYDSEEPFPSPICTCPIQRRAIKADREARVHGGVDWGRDEMQAERAHADALAEALRDIVNEAGLEFSDPRVGYETWQLDPGAIERGRKALAAHDALRAGSK